MGWRAVTSSELTKEPMKMIRQFIFIGVQRDLAHEHVAAVLARW
jgi:hypothetical protein